MADSTEDSYSFYDLLKLAALVGIGYLFGMNRGIEDHRNKMSDDRAISILYDIEIMKKFGSWRLSYDNYDTGTTIEGELFHVKSKGSELEFLELDMDNLDIIENNIEFPIEDY